MRVVRRMAERDSTIARTPRSRLRIGTWTREYRAACGAALIERLTGDLKRRFGHTFSRHKALMIHYGIAFHYMRDLSCLLLMLETHGPMIPDGVRQAQCLSPYATITRYPGVAEPVSEAYYQKAIEIAKAVVRWAEERL